MDDSDQEEYYENDDSDDDDGSDVASDEFGSIRPELYEAVFGLLSPSTPIRGTIVDTPTPRKKRKGGVDASRSLQHDAAASARCVACLQGAEDLVMLSCVICHQYYHTFCLPNPLCVAEIPVGDWNCPECEPRATMRTTTDREDDDMVEYDVLHEADGSEAGVASPERTKPLTSAVTASRKNLDEERRQRLQDEVGVDLKELRSTGSKKLSELQRSYIYLPLCFAYTCQIPDSLVFFFLKQILFFSSSSSSSPNNRSHRRGNFTQRRSCQLRRY
jgi:hypothetical protein